MWVPVLPGFMLRYKGAYPFIPQTPHPLGTTVPVPVPRLVDAGSGVKFLDMFEFNNIFLLFCIDYIFIEKSQFFPFLFILQN